MILNGVKIVLDPGGALFVPAASMLIVSDLHLEKGSAIAARGLPVPPYDTAKTLAKIKQATIKHRPAQIVSLGDSFQDRGAGERLDGPDIETIQSLTQAYDWVWITGNHDPDPPNWIGGKIVDELAFDGLVLRHEPVEGQAAGEIAGHLHPKASIRTRGRRIARRCFASDGRRLVMPAFGAYTGGLNVRDRAFEKLFPGPFFAHMLGDRKIHTIISAKLS
jgi:DNA ligase-associated metallophosphoesterase